MNSSLLNPVHLLFFSMLCFAPLSACDCEDSSSEVQPWELKELYLEDDDHVFAPEPEDAGIQDNPDLVVEPPDLTNADRPWIPEVVQDVSRTQAFNDRTSLDVGDDGEVWLGYHSCDDNFCSNPDLSVAHRTTGDTTWSFETIAPQNTTFGLVVYRNQPFAAYLDLHNNSFRVAQREGTSHEVGTWKASTLDVAFSGEYDGLDLTHDGSRMYVTFASNNSSFVELFVKDMTSSNADWLKLQSLEVRQGASAALERGIQADNKGNLLLVHRDGRDGPYGVARFRLRDNIWDRITYLPSKDILVSSMVARTDGDICMSTDLYGELLMTCGKMNELERDYYLQGEGITGYSSLIEGRDGSLIIAYNWKNNEELRVARRYPDGTWDIRTAFDGPSYGVSTAIDLENKLLISYYTCRASRCTLEILRQPY